MSQFSYIVTYIGSVVIVVSFLLALSVTKSKNIRPYMKHFFVYPLIGIILSINTILNIHALFYPKSLNFSIQSLLLTADLVFWVVFFSKLFGHGKDKIKLRAIFIVALCVGLFFYPFSTIDKPNLHIISIFNICKTLFCIYYYYKLFKTAPNQKIKAEPSFWIVTGLFFYSCLSVPFYALNGYLKSYFPITISANLFAVSNIMIIIMHFFFLKAYSCTARLHKVSLFS